MFRCEIKWWSSQNRSHCFPLLSDKRSHTLDYLYLCNVHFALNLTTMVSRAASRDLQSRRKMEKREELVQLAVTKYQARLGGDGSEKLSLRSACRAVEQEYFNKTGQHVTVSHRTVFKCLNNTCSLHECREQQSHITQEEVVVIKDVF